MPKPMDQIPHLYADPQRAGALLGLRVGLVWAGSAAIAADCKRSLPLECLHPFATLPGLNFVSLQEQPPAKQARPNGMALQDWIEERMDFGDTAAPIEALGLVITVDAAVVHLIGATSMPV